MGVIIGDVVIWRRDSTFTIEGLPNVDPTHQFVGSESVDVLESVLSEMGYDVEVIYDGPIVYDNAGFSIQIVDDNLQCDGIDKSEFPAFGINEIKGDGNEAVL
jgi:hypothetical protein